MQTPRLLARWRVAALPLVALQAGGGDESAAKKQKPAAGPECNPLAAAAEPEVWRRLKQGRCRSAASACGEVATSTPASVSEPASLDHLPGPTLAASIVGAEPAGELATTNADMPVHAAFAGGVSHAFKAGLVTEVAAGPPALCWEHYSGHLATTLGRSGCGATAGQLARTRHG